MSLTDKDNYFGNTHGVFEIVNHSVVVNNIENEVILGVNISYKIDGTILNVDTKYWRHFLYSSYGLQKVGEGTTVDTMSDTALEIFEKFKNELLKGAA